MSPQRQELVLESLFAPARALELTDAEVRAVLKRGTVPLARRQWMRVPPLGGLVALLAAASAVAVAVLALVLLGHRDAARPESAAGPVPASARPLVSALAVLRRPQTAADRGLSAEVAKRLVTPRPTGWRLDPGLTRLAVTLPGEDPVRVYLVVLLPPQKGPATAVAIAVPAEGRAFMLDQETPALLEQPNPPGSVPGPNGLTGSIVPDGVSRVMWAFERGGTEFPFAQSNIVLFHLARDHSPLGRVFWFGRHGKLIASYSSASTIARRRAMEEQWVTQSDKRPIAPLLIEHFALFRQPKRPGTPPLGLDNEAVFATGGGGLNVGMTRFVHVNETQPPVDGLPHGVWVIPGKSEVLLFDTHQTGQYFGLQGPDGPLSGRLAMTTSTDGRHWITGLVPDGNRTVTVVLATGTRENVPVVDNVYSTAINSRAVELIDKNASGHRAALGL